MIPWIFDIVLLLIIIGEHLRNDRLNGRVEDLEKVMDIFLNKEAGVE